MRDQNKSQSVGSSVVRGVPARAGGERACGGRSPQNPSPPGRGPVDQLATRVVGCGSEASGRRGMERRRGGKRSATSRPLFYRGALSTKKTRGRGGRTAINGPTHPRGSRHASHLRCWWAAKGWRRSEGVWGEGREEGRAREGGARLESGRRGVARAGLLPSGPAAPVLALSRTRSLTPRPAGAALHTAPLDTPHNHHGTLPSHPPPQPTGRHSL